MATAHLCNSVSYGQHDAGSQPFVSCCSAMHCIDPPAHPPTLDHCWSVSCCRHLLASLLTSLLGYGGRLSWLLKLLLTAEAAGRDAEAPTQVRLADLLLIFCYRCYMNV